MMGQRPPESNAGRSVLLPLHPHRQHNRVLDAEAWTCRILSRGRGGGRQCTAPRVHGVGGWPGVDLCWGYSELLVCDVCLYK